MTTKLVRKNLLGGVYYCVLDVAGGRIQAPILASDVPAKLAAKDVDAWLELHVDSQLPSQFKPGDVSAKFVEVRDIERQFALEGERLAKFKADADAERAELDQAMLSVRLEMNATNAEQSDALARLSTTTERHGEVAKDLETRTGDLAKTSAALTAAKAGLERIRVEISEADAERKNKRASLDELNAEVAAAKRDRAKGT